MSDSKNIRTASALRAMSHELSQMANEIEGGRDELHLAIDKLVSLDILSRLVARCYADRERRGEFLDRKLFGEPSWDMLLYLFSCSAEGRRVRESELASASGTPHSTALRYMDLLQGHGLVARSIDSSHQGNEIVSLTQEGMLNMAAYMCRTFRVRYEAERTLFKGFEQDNRSKGLDNESAG